MTAFKDIPGSGGLERSRAADQIFRDLRNHIVSGRFPRGARLPTEKELAERYQVSGPTVREAIRGLTLLGLTDVRHGSGTYVRADMGSVIAISLSTAIQMGEPALADVLDVLSVLNQHAASLAAEAGTAAEIEQLRKTLADLEAASDTGAAADAVRAFHHAIAVAAHNMLLEALCGFLADVQVELAKELAGDSLDAWRRIFTSLKPIRTRLVEAIAAHDREKASSYAREFHSKAAQVITSLPRAREVRLSDPKLKQLLLATMRRVNP